MSKPRQYMEKAHEMLRSQNKTTDVHVAIMTSGGDAQGMNACIRAVVRRAVVLNVKVYAILEGFVGLCNGKQIIELGWNDVSGLLPNGGTILGTSRCPEFMTREGRKKATLNLMKFGIDRLICIGGDGSLTGAELLSSEWDESLKALVSDGKLTKKECDAHPNLYIMGVIGSIDNDFWGTDMTIGCDSALHRITEAMKCIMTTASSHQRTFVVEVMGRGGGYLALYSSLAMGADYVFIPESPTQSDWREKMCRAISRSFELGLRQSIVVIAEGARDAEGRHISPNDVKKVIYERLNLDARVTIFGHVQRGGSPSGSDRLLATQMGVRAVDAILAAAAGSEAKVVCYWKQKLIERSLKEAVRETRKVSMSVEAKDFELAASLRGPEFVRDWMIYRTWARTSLLSHVIQDDAPAIAILNMGPPTPGMNSPVGIITRLATMQRYRVYGIYEGCYGLWSDNFEPLKWIDVDGWGPRGGVVLGTSERTPERHLEACARNLEKRQIRALFLIGGWEAYLCLLQFAEASKDYAAFRIPIVVIPSSIYNDCPCTTASIGTDTALNSILKNVDCAKQTATAIRRCAYIIEIDGRQCGYLGAAVSVSGSAHRIYTPEKPISLSSLSADVQFLTQRFCHSKTMALIINSDTSNCVYTTGVVEEILNQEGKKSFEARKVILGCTQQGNSPSPIDCVLGNRFGYEAFSLVTAHLLSSDDAGSLHGAVGLRDNQIEFVDWQTISQDMDFEKMRPRNPRWTYLLDIIDAQTPHSHAPLSAIDSRSSMQKLLRGNSIKTFMAMKKQNSQD